MNYLLNQKAELEQNKVLTTTIEDNFQNEEQTDILQHLDF